MHAGQWFATSENIKKSAERTGELSFAFNSFDDGRPFLICDHRLVVGYFIFGRPGDSVRQRFRAFTRRMQCIAGYSPEETSAERRPVFAMTTINLQGGSIGFQSF
jgi:hypothetical protein